MNVRLVMASMALALMIGGPCAADDGKDQSKGDRDRLQGEWVVSSVDVDGDEVADRKGRKLVIKGDDWAAPSGTKLKFRLNAAKDPKQLDLRLDQPEDDQSWSGIYKIDGDTLIFCRPRAAGGARPADFKGGPMIFRMVCRRAEKK